MFQIQLQDDINTIIHKLPCANVSCTCIVTVFIAQLLVTNNKRDLNLRLRLTTPQQNVQPFASQNWYALKCRILLTTKMREIVIPVDTMPCHSHFRLLLWSCCLFKRIQHSRKRMAFLSTISNRMHFNYCKIKIQVGLYM